MPAAEMLSMLEELPPDASQGDLLRYVERTRRQLDRFEQLPGADGRSIDASRDARIREVCDKLEADILMGVSTA